VALGQSPGSGSHSTPQAPVSRASAAPTNRRWAPTRSRWPLVRRGYAAFNTGDVETLRQLFADTTIFHEPGRSPISGDYQGLDQVLGFFGTLIERSGGTFRATLHDVVANDEHAIGLHSSDAERDGHTIRSPTVLVFHIRDGKLAETWSHHYDQHDFDAFWA
jgi:ketosteroid isomerase-like protein